MRIWYGASFSVFFIIINNGMSQFNKNVAGPFELVLKHVETCDDIGSGDLLVSMKVRKTSRTSTVLDGSLVSKIPMDDNISIVINVGQFTNNGVKKNFFQKEFGKFCSAMGVFLPKFKKQLMQKIGYKDCPIPPGNYSVHGLNFPESLQQIPIFFYNKYRTEVQYKRENKVVGCNVIFIDIVPKRARSRS